jgi:hypothetical protein
MHCFSFDIETVPDVEFGRRMWQLDGLSDEDVATAMTFLRQQASGSEFLPLHLRKTSWKRRATSRSSPRCPSAVSLLPDASRRTA